MAEYQQWMLELRGVSLGSLQIVDGEEVDLLQFVSDSEHATPARILERAELEKVVAEGMKKMPENERTVLSLYYKEELTLREIGSIMDLHTTRISQLRAQAILFGSGRLWNTNGLQEEESRAMLPAFVPDLPGGTSSRLSIGVYVYKVTGGASALGEEYCCARAAISPDQRAEHTARCIGARLNTMDQSRKEHSEWLSQAESLNLNRRGQVLRLHRRGDSASDIASALRMGKGEVQLMIKVYELSRDSLAPNHGYNLSAKQTIRKLKIHAC